MRKGHSFIFCGDGKGKTTQAIGQGIRAIGENLTVIMIQFLDYNNNNDFEIIRHFEPEFKIFKFEKYRNNAEYLDDSEKNEIKFEIRNAFNFTRKIIETGECDVLILDGILDAISEGYIDINDLGEVMDKRSESMDIIITGEDLDKVIEAKADAVYKISTIKNFQDEF